MNTAFQPRNIERFSIALEKVPSQASLVDVIIDDIGTAINRLCFAAIDGDLIESEGVISADVDRLPERERWSLIAI